MAALGRFYKALRPQRLWQLRTASALSAEQSHNTRVSIKSVQLSEKADAAIVEWADGRTSQYSSLWLRHHNRQGAAYQFSAKQKAFNSAWIASSITLSEASVERDVPNWGDVIRYCSPEDSSEGFVPAVVLEEYDWLRLQLDTDRRPVMARQVTYLQYESDDSEALRFNIYRALIDDGVCVIRGTPPEDNYLAEHFIPRLLECDVMSTQYGDSFYVRAVPDPINVAYAAYGLDMHQDMIYGESGPGLQLLHCLENSTLGGESLITDGMAVCEQLKEEEPEHFRVLSTTPILNESVKTLPQSGRQVHNRRFDPIIGIAGDGRVIGLRLTYVSEGVFLMRTPDEERAFLAAYRELQKRMERSRLAFRLGRGDLLVFNNRRMTHGRTAIEKNPALGDSAVRIFKGAYVEIDQFRSQAVIVHARNGRRIEPLVGNYSWM